jgi:hypothetical protein
MSDIQTVFEIMRFFFLILLILISLIGPKVLESKISKTNTGNYIDYSRIDIYLQNNFNANGAANGTTNSFGFTEFPPKGATSGGVHGASEEAQGKQ